MVNDFSFKDIPHKVLCLQLAGAMNIPVGSSFYNEVITEYPEYFPVEAERKRKWDAIPQSVHDAHWKELQEFTDELWKDQPRHTGGIFGMMNNTPEYQKYEAARERLRPIEEAKEKELRKKYYGPYGL